MSWQKQECKPRTGGRRADYVNEESMLHIMAALMPQNRLAMNVAIVTGLRINDVLSIKTKQLLSKNKGGCRITVKEQKTGYSRRLWLPAELRAQLLLTAGRKFVFEGRCDWRKHRTRQAVEKDMERARKLLRVPKSLTVSPHSARKLYAVQHKSGALQHRDRTVAMLYEMANVLTARRQHGKRTDLYD